MARNETEQSVKNITTVVSDRDRQIWENAAHSVCIRRETEKLKDEVGRLTKVNNERQQEIKVLENQLNLLTTSDSIPQETLQTSAKSLGNHELLAKSLAQESRDCDKKYSELLEAYTSELDEYRRMYESASSNYKLLKSKQIELKKLQIEKDSWCVKIADLVRDEELYRNIRNQIFVKTIVKFAEWYIRYHKNQEMETKILEMKNTKVRLLKEHFKLTDMLKQKKKEQLERSKAKTRVLPEIMPESEQLRKFFNEDIQTFSLTSLGPTCPVDANRVKILDVQVIKPVPRPVPKKPNIDLKRKMETMMETTKKKALKRIPSINIENFRAYKKSSQTTPSSSQQSNKGQMTPTWVPEIKPSPASQDKSQSVNSDSEPAKRQNEEKLSQDNTSKFFSAKKKTVTFQPTTIRPMIRPNIDEGFPSLFSSQRETSKQANKSTILSPNVLIDQAQSPTFQTTTTGYPDSGSSAANPNEFEEKKTYEVSFTQPNTTYDFVLSPVNMEEFTAGPDSSPFNFSGAPSKNNFFSLF